MRNKLAIALSAITLLIAFAIQLEGIVRPSVAMIVSGLIVFWVNDKRSWFCIDTPEPAWQGLNRYVGMIGSALTPVGLVLLVYRHGW